MNNSQRQIFLHQIALLQTQIEQQSKRQEALRNLNDTLQEEFKRIASEKQQCEQFNEQLTQKIKFMKDRNSEEVKYLDKQNMKLKTELNEKIKEHQRMDVQYQRRDLMYQEKINMLESMVEKKCHKVGDLQKKLHDQSISGFKETSRISHNQLPASRYGVGGDLAVSSIRYSHHDIENNMKNSNLSTASRQSKVNELIKLDKSQLKVMMGALIKSKNQLQQGNFDVSMSAGETTVKRNKTFRQ